jgi:uncharacterized protein with PIN domain
VPPDPEPRFLVDGMAVRLGKYLRCAGYDATWHPDESSAALARRATAEERVLLTRNTRIGSELAAPARWLALAGDDPVAHLHQVAAAFGLELARRLFTRCIRCNVALVPADPGDVAARVPEVVRARHALFFTCPACRTVFWRGSHVANTCRKLGLPPPEP